MHRRHFHACCALTAIALADCAVAKEEKTDQWGTLTATFLYDGEPPPREELLVDKDKGYYKDPVYDESLVVDPQTKGVANVVIWLYLGKDEPLPAIHESYAKQASEEVAIEALGGNISRRVTLMTIEQTLLIRNTEPIGHNLKWDSFSNTAFCELIPANGSSKKRLTKMESRPMPVACNIHAWESGWLLVRNNPYMAVSTSTGKLQIKHLPVGKHTFVLWHELPGYISEFKRDGKVEQWKHGKLTVDIKPGANDLGQLVFEPKRR